LIKYKKIKPLFKKNKYMKYIKLFENFSEEGFPKSITIELTDKFVRRMKEYKSGPLSGRALAGDAHQLDYPARVLYEIKLFNNVATGGGYNLVRIGTAPLHDYWICYFPEKNEVGVVQIVKTPEYNDWFSDKERYDYNPSLFSKDHIMANLKTDTAYYGHFENGFKVGEVDHLGYFKIVDIE